MADSSWLTPANWPAAPVEPSPDETATPDADPSSGGSGESGADDPVPASPSPASSSPSEDPTPSPTPEPSPSSSTSADSSTSELVGAPDGWYDSVTAQLDHLVLAAAILVLVMTVTMFAVMKRRN